MPADESQSVLSVLLFTDLVGSTDLKQRLGDAASARAVACHDRLFRECLARFGGTEQDNTGDGFFATFDVPSDAVRCALAFQQGLAGLDVAEPLASRVGIHMGEVLRMPAVEGQTRGKLIGLAVDMAARTMGLAQGGQILITRHAFDSVRQQALTAPDGSPVQWLAHGPYLFKGFDDPIEIFEAGVAGLSRLAPPPDSEKARRALAPGEEATLGWRPAVGLPVPGREAWIIHRRLGGGGFGEVWLARHKVTRETRAFKFCYEADRLRSLKRELTLFRLMKEVLGERPDIARLYEVQLDEAPYYLEMEYTSGGDLATWAAARGGIAAVPPATRLELTAQIADALAAAHSVGVIHKDVKPANVLIEERKDGFPQARLTDFGIGQLVSHASLAASGITVTGFDPGARVTMADPGPTTGTQLYMAPELAAGSPPSIPSDIYSLGVLLYEMVVGDLNRPVAHGWERDVDDELLREDIAACIAGSPADRLPTADTLARRLRTLDARRAERQAERDRARREQRRRRLLRLATGAVAVLSLVAIVAGVGYWRAMKAERTAAAERDRAVAAEKRAQHRFDQVHALAKAFIFDFHDEIAHLAGSTPAREMLVTEALKYLDSLSSESTDDPALRRDVIAAYLKVGDVLGSPACPNLGNRKGALACYEKASQISSDWLKKSPANADARRAMSLCRERTADILADQGRTDEALRALQEAHAINEKLAAEFAAELDYPRNLVVLKNKMGRLLAATGRSRDAGDAYRSALSIARALHAAAPANAQYARDVSQLLTRIGDVHLLEERYDEGMKCYDEAVAIHEKLAAAEPDNAQYRRDLALTLQSVGDMLLLQGRTDEARQRYQKVLDTYRALSEADPKNAQARRDLAVAFTKMGSLAAAKGRVDEALVQYGRARTIYEALVAADPQSVSARRDLALNCGRIGDVLRDHGRAAESIAYFDTAVRIGEEIAASDGANKELRGDLAWAYCRTAAAHAALGSDVRRPGPARVESWRQAGRWYRRSREVLEDLRRKKLLTPEQEGFIGMIDADIRRSDRAVAELAPADSQPAAATARSEAP